MNVTQFLIVFFSLASPCLLFTHCMCSMNLLFLSFSNFFCASLSAVLICYFKLLLLINCSVGIVGLPLSVGFSIAYFISILLLHFILFSFVCFFFLYFVKFSIFHFNQQWNVNLLTLHTQIHTQCLCTL